MAMACGGCTWKCLATHSSLSNECASFFIVMEGDFSSALEIPSKLALRIKCMMCKDAILKGPSGHLWHVKFCCTDTSVSFTDGWESFVSDNGIAAKDVLVFSCVIDTYFVVQVFGPIDGKKEGISSFKKYTSCCLQEDILLKVCNRKRCEHKKIPTKFSAAAHNFVVEPSTNEEIEATNLTMHKEDCSMAATDTSEEWICVPHKPENEISWSQASLFIKHQRNFNAVTEVAPCPDNDSDSETSAVQSPVVPMEATFSVIIKRGAVFGRSCKLTIPRKFAKLWLPKRNTKIRLMHHKNPGMWLVMLKYYRNYWRLSGGWKSFAVSNELHKHDKCVFTMVNTVNRIFVVYVTSGSLSRRGYNGTSRCTLCKASEDKISELAIHSPRNLG